jgi:hypothetical protein
MLERFIIWLLVQVAKRMPQKTFIEYLARFEYASYLFYRRHSMKLSEFKRYAESFTFENLARIEYNHYHMLCSDILGIECQSWEDTVRRDAKCEWSLQLNQQCDNLSTKYLSLKWFFKGKSAKDFNTLETAVFTTLIEQWQGHFYKLLYTNAITCKTIKIIAKEESLNGVDMMRTLINHYSNDYEQELKNWSSRKTIMWLLVFFDLIAEYIYQNVHQVLMEMDNPYFDGRNYD